MSKSIEFQGLRLRGLVYPISDMTDIADILGAIDVQNGNDFFVNRVMDLIRRRFQTTTEVTKKRKRTSV